MSGERILMQKISKGQNVDKGQKSFSRLEHKTASHSVAYHEQWRRLKVEGAGFGQTVHLELNTNLPVTELGLAVSLSAGANGENWCEAVASALLQSVTWKLSGRNILEYNFADKLLAVLQSYREEEDVAALRSICGGASGNAAREVIIPLFFWSDSISHGDGIAHRRPFANPPGSKLECEVRFADKADVCTGEASLQITNCEFIYTELLLPAAVEENMRQPIRKATRSIYRSLPEFQVAAGASVTKRLESMLSAGNITNIFVYARANKGTGANKEWPASNCVQPARVQLQINGTRVFDESGAELAWRRWTQGQNVQPGKCYLLQFGEKT